MRNLVLLRAGERQRDESSRYLVPPACDVGMKASV
jgi:hypothetical protein